MLLPENSVLTQKALTSKVTRLVIVSPHCGCVGHSGYRVAPPLAVDRMHEHTGHVQFQACVGAILLEALVLHEGDTVADAAVGFEDRSFRPLHVRPVREAGLVGKHFAGGGFVAAEIERQRSIVVLVFDDAAYLVVRLAVLVLPPA